MVRRTKSTVLLSEIMLTDAQLRAIGCLALESTHLEMYFESLIVDFCGTALSDLLLERKMLDAKVDIFFAVLKHEIHDAPRRDKFSSFVDKIKTDIVKRNTVIHGNWGTNLQLKDLKKRKSNAIGQRKKSGNNVKASDIHALALRFAQHQTDLLEWYKDILQNIQIGDLKLNALRSERLSQILLPHHSLTP